VTLGPGGGGEWRGGDVDVAGLVVEASVGHSLWRNASGLNGGRGACAETNPAELRVRADERDD